MNFFDKVNVFKLRNVHLFVFIPLFLFSLWSYQEFIRFLDYDYRFYPTFAMGFLVCYITVYIFRKTEGTTKVTKKVTKKSGKDVVCRVCLKDIRKHLPYEVTYCTGMQELFERCVKKAQDEGFYRKSKVSK